MGSLCSSKAKGAVESSNIAAETMQIRKTTPQYSRVTEHYLSSPFAKKDLNFGELFVYPFL